MMKTAAVVAVLCLVVPDSVPAEATDPDVMAREQAQLKARPLPLDAVRLTGGPLKHAQDLNGRILLGLEPDRLMAGYRIQASLEPRAPGYGGWDSVEGKQLTGHMAGHYLSGVSLMYAATGDERFRERADTIVREMQLVQDHRGNGYLGALADHEGQDGAVLFEEEVARGRIRSGGFDLNGMWSPWYTLHKTYAGLRDAYRYTGNRTALELEIRFAAWAESVLAALSDEQIQQMLNTEFGGMNEVFVDLYADTGDERWLKLSRTFEHQAVIEPLKRSVDDLAGKHGNTQVPKLIGSADRFACTGNESDLHAASFFWERVVRHHSFATGGHGEDEYFHEPDRLAAIIDGRTCETCNVYNMLKLTRRLFSFRPDAAYADFHERALFNHILSSQDPDEGWACYMVPVGRKVQREYERNMLDGNFTCCTGTSLETHALHADGLYYESGDTLYVNVYAPSRAQWRKHAAEVTVETGFPVGDSAVLEVTVPQPATFTLALRRPYWCEAFSVKVNGERVAQESSAPLGGDGTGRFLMLRRTWVSGDRIELSLPKTLRLEPTPDDPGRTAILWGPLVLAGDLSDLDASEDARVPAFVAAGQPVSSWLKPVAGAPGRFRSAGVGRPRDVDFAPFYQFHRRTYGVYWDLFAPEAWEAEQAAYEAEQERRRRLDAATVAYAQPGEMQPERNFNFRGGADTRPARTEGRAGRSGWTWFSFDLPVESGSPMALAVTYCTLERRRGEARFDVLVDGRPIATQTVKCSEPRTFYDVVYPVPESLVEGEEKVTVTFRAHDGAAIAGVYGLRMLRAEEHPRAPETAAHRSGPSVELYPLTSVRLLEEGPFSDALEANRAYLLAHDPDRLLAPFLREAGREPKATPYGNWESSGLDGHTAGHYLSALSMMIASGRDTDGEMSRRLDYMLGELDRCREAYGDGYIGGVPGSRALWDDLAAGRIDTHGFGLNGKWVPWYNVHKTFAGLRDACEVAGREEARALLIGLGDWCVGLVAGLTDEQMQVMLRAEHGGMNEVLADLFAMTGDEKFLQAARRFNHRAVLDPLLAHQDRLTGLHANTQIPKVIGLQRIASLTGDAAAGSGARFFWDTVARERSVAFGGNSVSEHFNDKRDFRGLIEHREGPETCNTYNMLRLTEQLFAAEPSARYPEFYERALFNHLLAAIHPEDPGYVYFTPLRPRHYRVYSEPEQAFWCCVGSGMENPGRYGRFIYARAADGIYVNLFIASELAAADGVTLRQETRFPFEPCTRLHLTLNEPASFALRLRHPGWVASGAFAVKVNGEPVSVSSTPCSYAEFRRTWRDGDVVDVELPMRTTVERLPDGSTWVALLRGPIVLAAPCGKKDLAGLRADDSRMGHVAHGEMVPLDRVPALLATADHLPGHIVPDPKAGPLHFRVKDVVEPAAPGGIPLKPFFLLHDERYQVYWELTSAEAYAERKERVAEEERTRAAREAATLDRVAIGEQQPEVEHRFEGGETETGLHGGRRWRHGDWFQYTLNPQGAKAMELEVTYWGGDRGRAFDILANGIHVATEELEAERPGRFFERRYAVLPEVMAASPDGRITVRFEARHQLAGGVYDLRLVRPNLRHVASDVEFRIP